MTREEATIQSLIGHIEALEETIKELQQESCDNNSNNRLIPVSEGLPKKDDLYLVYFDDGENGECDLIYFSNGTFDNYTGIIAWMPLPNDEAKAIIKANKGENNEHKTDEETFEKANK